MNNETLQKIILLDEKEKRHPRKSRKSLERIINFVAKADKVDSDTASQIRAFTYTALACANLTAAVFQEMREIRKREKIVSSLFDIDRSLVTGELDKFQRSPEDIEFYVDDFQYDASINSERMNSLKAVWGELNLKKLHDFRCASSLETVIGDLEISDAVNADNLKLKVVTGNITIGEVDSLDFLKDMDYIGGEVYYNNENITEKDEMFYRK